MSNVFVLDTNKQPLDPVHPGRARILLDSGKAAVFKRYPFTIILKAAITEPEVHPLRIKIDPGSQTTGIALLDDGAGAVVWAAELTHRGQASSMLWTNGGSPSRAQTTHHPLPYASFSESQAPKWVASPVSGKPSGERADLGEAARSSLSGRGTQPGTGQVRPATDGAARDQRRGLPAGDAWAMRCANTVRLNQCLYLPFRGDFGQRIEG